MRKSWRRTTLGAVVALLVLPTVADAAFTPTVTVTTVNSGCAPKGSNVLPAQTIPGTLTAGAHTYKVEATVGGADTAPCEQLVTAVPGGISTLVTWESTPGATQYKVFRDEGLVATVPAVPAVCPSSGADPGPRCRFVDTGAAAPGAAPNPLPTGNTQAGSSPDLIVIQGFDYSGAAADSSDDTPPNGSGTSASLKSNVLHFPAGLAASPLATTSVCTLSQLLGNVAKHGTADPAEDSCPRASQVGTITANIKTPGGNPAAPTVGDIYVGQKLGGGSETARLYVVLRPACSAGSFVAPGSATCNAAVGSGFEVEKSFLSAKATIRNDGTFGIDNETTSIADGTDQPLSTVSFVDETATGDRRTTGSPTAIPIQVQRIRQNLFGLADQGTASTSDDRPFVVMPTSCAAKTFAIDASSYLDPAGASASAGLQATNCEAVPFTPQVAFEIDASGDQAKAQGHPAFTATITQPAGEAAQKKAVVTLPSQLRVNANAVGATCQVSNPTSASQCPDSAIIGSATATTPLLPGTFSGPVYLTQGTALPNLDVFLSGPADIHLHGSTGLTSGGTTRLVNTFDNLPEVPLTSFTLTVKGGANGLLENAQSLCDGVGDATAEFTGHNGATVTRTAAVKSNAEYYCVPGAGTATRPKFKVRVRGVKKGRPRMAGSIRRGANGVRSAPRKARVILPKGMRFTKKAKRRITVRVDGDAVRTFTAKGRVLKIKPGHRARRFTFYTRKGAIKESRKIRRKGRKQRLRFRALVKVEGGKTFHLSRRVRPRS